MIPILRALLAVSLLSLAMPRIALTEAGRPAAGPDVFHPCRSASHSAHSDGSTGDWQGVQIETSDVSLYERFFTRVLGAEEVLRIDHPQVDHLRGYCYRGVLMIIRQDLKTPRPTGWVQVNFTASDVAAIQRDVEQAVSRLDASHAEDAQLAEAVRVRLKPDVPRTHCRAVRLEIGGPEGFMIGFDQFKEGSCKRDAMGPPSSLGEQARPHHEGRER